MLPHTENVYRDILPIELIRIPIIVSVFWFEFEDSRYFF